MGKCRLCHFAFDDVSRARTFVYYLGSVRWLNALTPPLERHLQKLAGTIKPLPLDEYGPNNTATSWLPPRLLSRTVRWKFTGNSKQLAIGIPPYSCRPNTREAFVERMASFSSFVK